MQTIKGLYDGKIIKPLAPTPKNKKYKVIITFLEELDDTYEFRDFTAQTSSFSFWENPKEDLYQDFLPKK